MSESLDAESLALRFVIDEVRLSTPPDIDWEGLERRTLATIDAETLAAARADMPSRRSGLEASFAFAVVVAALVALVTGLREPSFAAGTSALAAAVPTAADGARLATAIPQGTEIVAGERGTRVVWPGVVSWELAPGARAALTRDRGRPSLRLEQGRVTVTVTAERSAGVDLAATVVESGHARFAARSGASFVVTAARGNATLDVVAGTVRDER